MKIHISKSIKKISHHNYFLVVAKKSIFAYNMYESSAIAFQIAYLSTLP